jgi:hypothetical protein
MSLLGEVVLSSHTHNTTKNIHHTIQEMLLLGTKLHLNQ